MHDIVSANSLYLKCRRDSAAARSELDRGIQSADPLLRHVAAIQMMLRFPEAVPEQSVAEMVRTLQEDTRSSKRLEALNRDYSEATFVGGNDYMLLGQHIAIALAGLPPRFAALTVPPLLEIWLADRQFYEAALAAIAIAFPASPVRPETMSQLQLQVLKSMVMDEAIWNCCGDAETSLRDRGLPISKEAMRDFIKVIG